jgi:beta-xylosidase
MGVNVSAAGTGEPVESYRKPRLDAAGLLANPADSDEFNGASLGLQWQWQANPQPNWAFPAPALGALRLVNVPTLDSTGSGSEKADLNLWTLPNLLLQKFPAPTFTVTAKVKVTPRFAGDQTGLAVLGRSYSALVLRKSEAGLSLRQTTRLEADQGGTATDSTETPVQGDTFYLRAAVDNRAMVHFFYSLDGKSYQAIGSPFQAVTGVWIGAKIGLFATGTQEHGELGYADYDWFRFDME